MEFGPRPVDDRTALVTKIVREVRNLRLTTFMRAWLSTTLSVPSETYGFQNRRYSYAMPGSADRGFGVGTWIHISLYRK